MVRLVINNTKQYRNVVDNVKCIYLGNFTSQPRKQYSWDDISYIKLRGYISRFSPCHVVFFLYEVNRREVKWKFKKERYFIFNLKCLKIPTSNIFIMFSLKSVTFMKYLDFMYKGKEKLNDILQWIKMWGKLQSIFTITIYTKTLCRSMALLRIKFCFSMMYLDTTN